MTGASLITFSGSTEVHPDYDRIVDLIGRLRLRPGCRITFDWQGYLTTYMHVTPLGASSYSYMDAGDEVHFTRSMSTYTTMPDNIVIEMIRSMFNEMDRHEWDEWLALDGVQVRDPHPEYKGLSR